MISILWRFSCFDIGTALDIIISIFSNIPLKQRLRRSSDYLIYLREIANFLEKSFEIWRYKSIFFGLGFNFFFWDDYIILYYDQKVILIKNSVFLCEFVHFSVLESLLFVPTDIFSIILFVRINFWNSIFSSLI